MWLTFLHFWTLKTLIFFLTEFQIPAMKLVQLLVLACSSFVALGSNATSIGFTKCSLCKLAVSKSESIIVKEGCSLLFDAEAVVLCQTIGLGPEDPLSDICVPLLIKGCSIIANDLEKHISNSTKTCMIMKLC